MLRIQYIHNATGALQFVSCLYSICLYIFLSISSEMLFNAPHLLANLTPSGHSEKRHNLLITVCDGVMYTKEHGMNFKAVSWQGCFRSEHVKGKFHWQIKMLKPMFYSALRHPNWICIHVNVKINKRKHLFYCSKCV